MPRMSNYAANNRFQWDVPAFGGAAPEPGRSLAIIGDRPRFQFLTRVACPISVIDPTLYAVVPICREPRACPAPAMSGPQSVRCPTQKCRSRAVGVYSSTQSTYLRQLPVRTSGAGSELLRWGISTSEWLESMRTLQLGFLVCQ